MSVRIIWGDVIPHLFNLRDGFIEINRMRATIGTPVDYAEAVHEGSRAHEIYPRYMRALWWQGAAHPIRHVHHPGTRPNPFLKEAFEARKDTIVRSIAVGLAVATVNGALSAAGPFADAIDKTTELARELAPVGPPAPGRVSGSLRASLHATFYAR